MDNKTLRRAHLERHIRQFRSAEEFLDALNDGLQSMNEKPVSASYVSQIRLGPPKGRNIGDAVARKLEEALGLPPTAFDQAIDSEPTELEIEAAAMSDKWMRLPPERRAIVLQTLEALGGDDQEM